MKRWFSWMLGMLAAVLTGCQPEAPRHEAAEPSAAGTNVTEIVHVDAAGAAKMLAAGDVVVVDVRTPGEYAGGHLAGATNIDFNASDFKQRLAGLDPARTYLVHCAVGGRSTASLPVFQSLGFKKVVHLDGGFRAWQAAGQPVAK